MSIFFACSIVKYWSARNIIFFAPNLSFDPKPTVKSMSLSTKIIISALIRISFNRPLVGSFEPLGLAIVITGILIELNKSLYKSLFLLCDKDGLAIIIGFALFFISEHKLSLALALKFLEKVL